jgi:hypothetical protein
MISEEEKKKKEEEEEEEEEGGRKEEERVSVFVVVVNKERQEQEKDRTMERTSKMWTNSSTFLNIQLHSVSLSSSFLLSTIPRRSNKLMKLVRHSVFRFFKLVMIYAQKVNGEKGRKEVKQYGV